MFKVNRRTIGYSIAILIVIVAILATLVRMLTPYYLEQYHQQIENVISHAIGKQVEIGNMEAGWYWYRPIIKFSDVVISEPDHPQESLKINQIGFAIKPLSSLRKKQIQPSLIYASGAHIKVQDLEDGSFFIEGFGQVESHRGQNKEFRIDRDLQLTFPKQTIILRNFEFEWQRTDGSIISVKDFNLNFKGKGSYFQLSGRAKIDQVLPTAIHFTGSAKGNFEEANLYLDVENMQVNQWLQGYDWKGLQVKNGLVSTQLWISIRHSNVASVRSTFDLNGIDINGVDGEHEQYLHHLSGQLHWSKGEDGWKLQGDRINLETGDVSWNNNYFNYTSETTENGKAQHLSVDQLNIGLILPYLYHAQVLPEEIQDKMLTLDPHGDFSDLQFDYLDDEESSLWEVKAKFEQLGWQKWEKIPGAEGLTGAIEFNSQQGSLQLDSHQAVLEFDKLFESPIDVDALSGELSWSKDDDGWTLKAEQITVENADVTAQGQFSIDIPADGSSPTVNIEAHASTENVTQAQYLIPTKILPEKLDDWLGQALLHGGQGESTFLLRGKLSDYPFDDQEGVFVVDTDITGLDFSYFNGWPVLQHMSANLVFNKRDMYALVKSASVQGIPVNNIEIAIPQIGKGEETLGIQGLIHGDASNGIAYMRNTPLIEHLAVFNMLELTGPMALSLEIKIPLHDKAAPMSLDGRVFLTHNDAAIPDLKIETTQTNGELYFNQAGVVDSHFNASFLGFPTEFSINTEHNTADAVENTFTQVNISGRTDIQDLAEQFSFPIAEYIQGETDYQANVKIYHEGSKIDNELSLSSNLKGISINFPPPLGKDADQSIDFHLLAQIADNKDLKVQFNLADSWSAYLLLNALNPGYELDGGEVRLGGGQALVPQGPGLSIIGSVPSLFLEQWYTYIQNEDNNHDDISDDAPAQETDLDGIVQFIDLRIGKAYVLGQQFDNVDLNAVREDDAWNVTVNSDAVSGDIRLSDQVEGRLKKLYLQAVTGEEKQQNEGDAPTAIHLPPLDVVVDDFRVEDRLLGQLTLMTHAGDDDALVIDTLSLQSPDYQLLAQGQWDITGYQNRTQLNGSLEIDHVTNLLQAWNLPPRFTSRNGQINFDLMWFDTPSGFAIEKLNGDLDFTFRYGSITDLSRATEEKLGLAKIFTLLSLSTLPRRLQLDFSDLSSPGYSFDIFQGNAYIRDGHAKINSTFLEGPVAYIGIDGDVGIAAKDYNLELRIVPHVTSSLPIVATVLGGPIVGAAVFVADKVVDYSFREVSPYIYKVTGSWEAPDIQAIEAIEADEQED